MIWAKGLLKVHLVNRWGVSLIEVSTARPMTTKQWHHVVVAYDCSRKAKGLGVFVDGSPAKLDVRLDTLEGTIANAQPLRIGRRDEGLGFYGRIDELRIVRQALDEKAIGDWFWGERIRGILERDAASRDTRLARYIDGFGNICSRLVLPAGVLWPADSCSRYWRICSSDNPARRASVGKPFRRFSGVRVFNTSSSSCGFSFGKYFLTKSRSKSFIVYIAKPSQGGCILPEEWLEDCVVT